VIPVPKPFIYISLTLATAALIPPALIARARTRTQTAPRIHYVQDMDNQAKFRAQHANPLFADGRAMRPRIDGVVPRGELDVDDHLFEGVAGGQWATTFPSATPVDTAFARRGEERFAIFCTPCHGVDGYGNGMVNIRAQELLENPAIGNGTEWVQPKNIHEPEIREQPVGQIYNTITNGVRNMAGYSAQIPVEDRWAITLWVKVLQRSQTAEPGDVPSGLSDLATLNLMPPEEDE